MTDAIETARWLVEDPGMWSNGVSGVDGRRDVMVALLDEIDRLYLELAVLQKAEGE